MLPAFLSLRAERPSHLVMFRRGALGLCAKLVMDALSGVRWPATREFDWLPAAPGWANAQKKINRAMKELKEES